MSRMTDMVLSFIGLSLLAVGGANSVIPDMHRQFVEVYGWLSDDEFTRLFAIAQAAPGPNVMIVSLIGWHVAGWPGAMAAMAAMCGPSSLLSFLMARLWQRGGQAGWRRLFQTALAPLTVGLVAASGLVLAETADHGWGAVLVTLATAVAVVRTRLNPLWLLAAGAALGMAGLAF